MRFQDVALIISAFDNLGLALVDLKSITALLNLCRSLCLESLRRIRLLGDRVSSICLWSFSNYSRFYNGFFFNYAYKLFANVLGSIDSRHIGNLHFLSGFLGLRHLNSCGDNLSCMLYNNLANRLTYGLCHSCRCILNNGYNLFTGMKNFFYHRSFFYGSFFYLGNFSCLLNDLVATGLLGSLGNHDSTHFLGFGNCLFRLGNFSITCENCISAFFYRLLVFLCYRSDNHYVFILNEYTLILGKKLLGSLCRRLPLGSSLFLKDSVCMLLRSGSSGDNLYAVLILKKLAFYFYGSFYYGLVIKNGNDFFTLVENLLGNLCFFSNRSFFNLCYFTSCDKLCIFNKFFYYADLLFADSNGRDGSLALFICCDRVLALKCSINLLRLCGINRKLIACLFNFCRRCCFKSLCRIGLLCNCVLAFCLGCCHNRLILNNSYNLFTGMKNFFLYCGSFCNGSFLCYGNFLRNILFNYDAIFIYRSFSSGFGDNVSKAYLFSLLLCCTSFYYRLVIKNGYDFFSSGSFFLYRWSFFCYKSFFYGSFLSLACGDNLCSCCINGDYLAGNLFSNRFNSLCFLYHFAFCKLNSFRNCSVKLNCHKSRLAIINRSSYYGCFLCGCCRKVSYIFNKSICALCHRCCGSYFFCLFSLAINYKFRSSMLGNYITCVRTYTCKITCFFVFCSRNVIFSYDFVAFCNGFCSFGFFFLYYFFLCRFFNCLGSSFRNNRLNVLNDNFLGLCFLHRSFLYRSFFCRCCRCFNCFGSFFYSLFYRSRCFRSRSLNYVNYVIISGSFCYRCCRNFSCFLGNGVCTLCLRSGDNLAIDNLCIRFAYAIKKGLCRCNKISCDNEH